MRGLSGLNFVRAFVVLDYDLLLTPSFVQKYFSLHVNSHKITSDHCICEQWRVSDFSFCKWKKQIQKNETNYMHVFLSGEAGNAESYSDYG